MTMPSIGAVVRCGDLVAGVYRTVACLLNGLAPADAVAIVADPSTPATAEPWLAAFAAARRLPFLRVESTSPGASWNAGLAAVGTVDFAICVESGESLDRSALDVMTRRMSSNPSTAVVTTGIEWIGPGTRHTFTEAPGCSPCDLLADPIAVHVSSLFRWPLWKASAGFDENDARARVHRLLAALDWRRRRCRCRASAVAAKAGACAGALSAQLVDRGVSSPPSRHCSSGTGSSSPLCPARCWNAKSSTVIREYLRHEGNRARLHAAEAEIERLRARRAEALAECAGRLEVRHRSRCAVRARHRSRTTGATSAARRRIGQSSSAISRHTPATSVEPCSKSRKTTTHDASEVRGSSGAMFWTSTSPTRAPR